MLEILENLETWQKWTGASVIVVLFFLFFLFFSGNKEAVELPSTINKIKVNVTEEVIEESGNSIVGAFHDMGVSLANDVDDPVVSGQIVFLSTFVGVMLFLAVILAVSRAMGFKI